MVFFYFLTDICEPLLSTITAVREISYRKFEVCGEMAETMQYSYILIFDIGIRSQVQMGL